MVLGSCLVVSKVGEVARSLFNKRTLKGQNANYSLLSIH